MKYTSPLKVLVTAAMLISGCSDEQQTSDIHDTPSKDPMGFVEVKSEQLPGTDGDFTRSVGTIDKAKAVKLTVSSNKQFLYVIKGKRVHNYNDAKAECKKIKPAGKWQLPTVSQIYLMTFFNVADPIISKDDVLPLLGPEEKGSIYWGRFKDKAKNKSILEGTTEAFIEGRGQLQLELYSIKTVTASLKSSLNERQDLSEDIRAILRDMLKSLGKGTHVYCVNGDFDLDPNIKVDVIGVKR